MDSKWTNKTSTGIVNVHSRWAPGTLQRSAEIFDRLAVPRESVWPSYRWPALILDQGLITDSGGGHGAIRYCVTESEPGCRVRFRFEDEMSFSGWHQLQALPERGGVRWTHTLSMDHPSLFTRRVVVRLHDALLEDLLDGFQAQMTGKPVLPRTQSVGVRLALAAVRWARPRPSGRPSARAQAGADVASAVLLAIGALHGAWAAGVVWPGKSRDDLARRVISTGRLPGAAPCIAVAGLLGGGAALVQARTRSAGPLSCISYPIADTGSAVTAGVLTLRGVQGLVSSGVRRRTPSPYRELDTLLYSPLCLGLAALVASARSRRTRSA